MPEELKPYIGIWALIKKGAGSWQDFEDKITLSEYAMMLDMENISLDFEDESFEEMKAEAKRDAAKETARKKYHK